jgi:hypothetical protein
VQDVGKQLYIQRGAPPLRQARLSLQASLIAEQEQFFSSSAWTARLHNSPVLALLPVISVVW